MLGGAIEKEQSFLKCNKIYQGAGHAAVGFWDPAARATEAAPWQALQQWVVGGWMGVGVVLSILWNNNPKQGILQWNCCINDHLSIDFTPTYSWKDGVL